MCRTTSWPLESFMASSSFFYRWLAFVLASKGASHRTSDHFQNWVWWRKCPSDFQVFSSISLFCANLYFSAEENSHFKYVWLAVTKSQGSEYWITLSIYLFHYIKCVNLTDWLFAAVGQINRLTKSCCSLKIAWPELGIDAIGFFFQFGYFICSEFEDSKIVFFLFFGAS